MKGQIQKAAEKGLEIAVRLNSKLEPLKSLEYFADRLISGHSTCWRPWREPVLI